MDENVELKSSVTFCANIETATPTDRPLPLSVKDKYLFGQIINSSTASKYYENII